MRAIQKKSKTKRSLWLSAASLLLCLTLLVATTFAWFTDVVKNKGNVIQAGELSIGVVGWDASPAFVYVNAAGTPNPDPATAGGPTADYPFRTQATTYTEVAEADKFDLATNLLINDDKWEPSLKGRKYIRVTNAGNIDAKYKLSIALDGVDPDIANLAEVLNVSIRLVDGLNLDAPAPEYARLIDLATTDGLTYDTEFDAVPAFGNGYQYYRLDYYFCDWAGNEYQKLPLKVNLIVSAIQFIADDEDLVTVGSFDELLAAVVPAGSAQEANVQDLSSDYDDFVGKSVNGSTIILTNDITIPADFVTLFQAAGYSTLSIQTPHNYDLNGFTLDTNGLALAFDFDVACAMDIANGTIIAKSLTIDTPSTVVNLVPGLLLKLQNGTASIYRDTTPVVHGLDDITVLYGNAVPFNPNTTSMFYADIEGFWADNNGVLWLGGETIYPVDAAVGGSPTWLQPPVGVEDLIIADGTIVNPDASVDGGAVRFVSASGDNGSVNITLDNATLDAWSSFQIEELDGAEINITGGTYFVRGGGGQHGFLNFIFNTSNSTVTVKNAVIKLATTGAQYARLTAVHNNPAPSQDNLNLHNTIIFEGCTFEYESSAGVYTAVANPFSSEFNHIEAGSDTTVIIDGVTVVTP